MPALVLAATGFAAIILIGTAAAWLYDTLEARLAELRVAPHGLLAGALTASLAGPLGAPSGRPSGRVASGSAPRRPRGRIGGPAARG